MYQFFRSVGWLLLLSGTPFASQPQDPLEYVRILESADRVRKLQVNRVIQNLGLIPGQVVADLGAGSGLFARPLAQRVSPGGKVYAIDIDRQLLAHIEETAREEGIANIQTVLAGEFDPRIPEKVELVLICDTLHQIRDPELYLRDLTRYLRDGARVAIIDYERNWPVRLQSSRFSVSQLDGWMKNASFRKERSFGFLKDNFFIIYRYAAPGQESTP